MVALGLPLASVEEIGEPTGLLIFRFSFQLSRYLLSSIRAVHQKCIVPMNNTACSNLILKSFEYNFKVSKHNS